MTFLPVLHASHLNYVGSKLAALRSPSIHVPSFLMTQACLIGPNLDLLRLSPVVASSVIPLLGCSIVPSRLTNPGRKILPFSPANC